jgi:hypothetical protein
MKLRTSSGGMRMSKGLSRRTTTRVGTTIEAQAYKEVKKNARRAMIEARV